MVFVSIIESINEKQILIYTSIGSSNTINHCMYLYHFVICSQYADNNQVFSFNWLFQDFHFAIWKTQYFKNIST